MELRRAADVLVRSQSSPLSSLLNPASTSRWAARTHLCYRTANSRPTQRTFTNSARSNALRPQATTSATPTIAEARNSGTPSSSVDELSKSLWARPPRSAPGRLDPELEKRMNGGSSAADILLAMRAAGGGKPSTGFDASLMLDPLMANDNNKTMMSDLAMATAIPQRPKIPMRLTPSTGRSIAIGTGIDVARGLRLLEQSCARNRVRADFTMQRFHERGGLKRKRLRRQRWRRRFMEGFRATVGRVKQLKNQGW